MTWLWLCVYEHPPVADPSTVVTFTTMSLRKPPDTPTRFRQSLTVEVELKLPSSKEMLVLPTTSRVATKPSKQRNNNQKNRICHHSLFGWLPHNTVCICMEQKHPLPTNSLLCYETHTHTHTHKIWTCRIRQIY